MLRSIVFIGGPAHHRRARTTAPEGAVLRVRGGLYVITGTRTVHGYVAEYVTPGL